MDEQEEYRQARRRVQSLKGFYIHAFVFASVMVLLLAINIATGGFLWVIFPFLGWGIGLAAHAAAVFGLAGALGAGWEERKIKELMAKRRQE